MRCAVIGAGAWGTALADLLAAAGHDVRIWAYELDVVQTINERHENTRFLAGARLTPELIATNEQGEALRARRSCYMRRLRPTFDRSHARRRHACIATPFSPLRRRGSSLARWR